MNKKTYEKPVIEIIDFKIEEDMMSDFDLGVSGGEGDWDE